MKFQFINPRFSNFNRDHARDQKPFRKNQGSIFISQSDPDFSGKIDPRFSFSNRIAIEKRFWEHKHRRNGSSGSVFPVKIDQRFSFQNRFAIFIFKSDPDFKIFIAITVAIENLIQISQTLIENFQPDIG